MGVLATTYTADYTTMGNIFLLVLILTILSPAAEAAERQPANLLQLYDLALGTNPVVEGRKYSVVQAEAQHDQARSKLLPQASATGNLSWNEFTQEISRPLPGQTAGTVTSQYQGLRGVVQARQALFDLASYRTYEGAEFTVKQAEQDLDNARMGLATNLVDRYLEFLQAHDEASYLQGELDLTEGDMQRIRRMYERTMAKVTDVYEVEAYYETLKTRELEIHNAKAVALEKVREVVGVPVADLARLTKEELPPVSGESDQWATRSRVIRRFVRCTTRWTRPPRPLPASGLTISHSCSYRCPAPMPRTAGSTTVRLTPTRSEPWDYSSVCPCIPVEVRKPRNTKPSPASK
jgi:outer membrane protein